ncbi:hypothetical protein A2Y99_02985 [Candidatus Gottesmanbacteria bacterium RBG_13_37_7]|uniref:Uncharacterized protein n=1 Tax=Candidatus Gottesmanbacteria bacterium RBG_13_37_7 TaxID=1798369 RepID=A0A1F5YIB7_9BACT|nr:MAG: hypothetical protein A2Y99_02985 [Candidatus Gottesmanbacteria bacterium RBG_13_37_7]
MKKKDKHSNFVVSGLLDYLTETNQTTLLPEVARELQFLTEESKKADAIIVTSSVALTAKQYEYLVTVLKTLLNINLPLRNIVDKKILGGLTIKVGNWYLDATLIKEINNISQLLISG